MANPLKKCAAQQPPWHGIPVEGVSCGALQRPPSAAACRGVASRCGHIPLCLIDASMAGVPQVTVQSAMGKLWMTTNMNNMSQGNWRYAMIFAVVEGHVRP